MKQNKTYSFNELEYAAQQKALEEFFKEYVPYMNPEDDEYLLGCRAGLNLDKPLFIIDKVYYSVDRDNYIQFHGLKITNENVFLTALGIPEKYSIEYYRKNMNLIRQTQG